MRPAEKREEEEEEEEHRQLQSVMRFTQMQLWFNEKENIQKFMFLGWFTYIVNLVPVNLTHDLRTPHKRFSNQYRK